MKTIYASQNGWVIAVVACLVLSLMGAVPVGAATMTADQVKTAVETWVHNTAIGPRPEVFVERLEPYPPTGRPAAYVAHLSGGGYCLAGADDRLLPITVYQPSAPFDPGCPDLAMLLDDYASRLEKIETAIATSDPDFSRYAGLLAERRDAWAALAAGKPAPRVDTELARDVPQVFALPMTSRWDQGSPYNSQCPVLTPPDEQVVVGCVATAAAQIMRYWQWPPAGVGSSNYVYPFSYTNDWISTYFPDDVDIPARFANRLEWSSQDGGTLRMNGYWDDSIMQTALQIPGGYEFSLALFDLFSHLIPWGEEGTVDHSQAYFDWAQMQDAHTPPPDPNDYEVAELSLNFAVAASMDFGVWLSGASHINAVHAYTQHFRYSSDADTFAINDGLIIDDLLWLRPVQLRGQNDDGGHSWVLHGYDVIDGLYLTNYGWGGGSDWVARDELFPVLQKTINYIAPTGVVKFVGNGNFGGNGGPAAPYANLEVAAQQAPDGALLIFRTSGVYDYGSAVTIDRPMTLKGVDVRIGPQ